MACVQSQGNTKVSVLAQRHRATRAPEEHAKLFHIPKKPIYLPETLLDTFLFKVQIQIKVDTWRGKVK